MNRLRDEGVLVRIAFTVPNYRPRITGPGQLVEQVARACAKKGHDCLVLTRGRPDDRTGSERGIDMKRLIGPKGTYSRGIEVRAELERFSPDFVFVHEMRNPLTLAAGRWAATKRVRWALQPHGEWGAYRHMPHFWQRASFWFYDALRARDFPGLSAEVVSTSVLEETELRGLLGARAKIVRLYLGTDIVPRRKDRSPGPRPRVLKLANFGVFREPRRVIEASKRLHRDGIDHELVLAGGFAPHSILTRKIREPSPKDATYVGPVATEARQALFESADLFVYLSRYESFGLPILEAAASGLPMVATATGLAPELEPSEYLLRQNAPTQQIYDKLKAALLDLPRRAEAARKQAIRLSKWADVQRRADAYRVWIESGDAPLEPPPRVEA